MKFELLKLDPHIKFINPFAMAYIRRVSLSDASYGDSEDIQGKTGIICGIMVQFPDTDDRIFHPIV